MEKEIFGEGRIKSLEGILKHYSAQHVFLVTGKKSYELSGAKEKLENQLQGRDYHRHFDFEENPKFSDLLQGAKAIQAYNPDIIVAVGGGSVMDTAKILSVLPTDTIKAKKVIKGDINFDEKITPIIAIPTTSGSGSEATHFAVAYVDNVKYSVAGKSLLPDHVILDPELTYSMSPYQTAVSGMDALCQGIESYWAKGATEESREYSSKAIEEILGSLENAVNNPTPIARQKMARGAFLAGKAINISKTTAPHALSYSLTTYYGIPHGHAVALTIGDIFVLNEQNGDEELKKTMEELANIMDCKNAEDCKVKIHSLMSKIALVNNLSDLGIEANNLVNIISDSVNMERLKNHPFVLSKDEIEDVLIKLI